MNRRYVKNLSKDIELNKYLLKIIKKLPKNSIVVDYGCGNFKLLKRIKELRNNLTLVGFDIIDYDSAEIPEGIKYYNIKKIKLEDFIEYADLIISTYVIEHIENPENLFENLVKITKRRGYIFLETENWTTILNGTFWFDATHKRPFDSESLKQLCKLNNVKTIKVSSYITRKEVLLIPYLLLKSVFLLNFLAFRVALRYLFKYRLFVFGIKK